MFFLFLFRGDAFALSLSFDGAPNEINGETEFSANVFLDCAKCGVSYLRGVFFYPETSHVYSGFTKNKSGEWVSSGDDKTQFFKVEEGRHSGQLKFKFDLQKPAREYFFKIGRYTSASSSATWSSNTSSINILTPTPTPSPNQTTPTPIVTTIHKTTSSPTPTSFPSPVLTTISTIPKKTPIPIETPTSTIYPDVLGSTASATPSNPSQSPTPNIAENQPNPMGTATFFGIAATVGLLSLAFWRLGKITRSNKLKL